MADGTRPAEDGELSQPLYITSAWPGLSRPIPAIKVPTTGHLVPLPRTLYPQPCWQRRSPFTGSNDYRGPPPKRGFAVPRRRSRLAPLNRIPRPPRTFRVTCGNGANSDFVHSRLTFPLAWTNFLSRKPSSDRELAQNADHASSRGRERSSECNSEVVPV